MTWFYIYNIFLLPLLWLFFKFLSIFSPKVSEGFDGRKTIFKTLEASNSLLNFYEKKVIIHSSSLGEYQQSIPLIEELRKKKYGIICTFFSSSGYKHSVMPFDDIIKIYLPYDSLRNIRKFLDLIKPEIIIMMRYDLWFNLLWEAKKRDIKLVIANARFDHKDKFWNLKTTSSFKKAMYRMVDKIFVINDEDENNYRNKLKKFKGEIIRVGDSKYERVFEAAKSFEKKDIMPENIYEDKKVFVIGSSWKDDEDVILPVLDKIVTIENKLLTILVPHEPKLTKINAIEKNLSDNYKQLSFIRFSNLQNYKDERIIIVDSVGKLAQLYSIAYCSYVGGGFRTGLHNVLEPVIFNMPVIFSNKEKNSDEDELLIEYGCGFNIENEKQFYRIFRKILSDANLRNEIGEKCNIVFKETLGTAKKIINNITNS